MWDPVDSDLGTVNEMTNFSHTVTYEVVDESSGLTTEYNVTISPAETNPNTVVIQNGITATISGYYFDSFPVVIQYLNKSEDYITVDKFSKIDEPNLDQMISYKASTNRTKIFTYNAIAKNEQGNIVAQKSYTKTIQNDWTAGRDSLVYYVGKT